MILKICKNVRKKSNIIILLLVFGWHQSSSVYRLFASTVIWLFADFSLNVSRCLLAHRTSVFRCQHFILALCFNNKLCTHLCMRAGYEKKTRILVFHISKMEEEGVCGSINTRRKKKSLLNHLHRNYFLCSSSSQAFSLCRSSLSHYHWFKVLWEKAEYLYVFLMFGQQWTIAQLRDGGLSSHISTLAPTNQLNVLIFVLKVKCWYFLWASCLFRRQKKHSAALLFFAYSDYFITPRLWTNGQKN